MIVLSIFTSVEFFVGAFIVAAAIVAYFALPKERGPARQILLAGKLEEEENAGAQRIEVTVDDDLNVTIARLCIPELTEAGAVSLAIEIRGFDIEIKERITRSYRAAQAVNSATFVLEGALGRERYHVHYHNPDTGQTAAFTLAVTPGMRIAKPLV